MATLKERNNHGSDFDLYGDISKLKEALSTATNDVKGRAAELLVEAADDIKYKASAVKHGVEDYTATKPMTALGIALVAGLVIGFFMGRTKG